EGIDFETGGGEASSRVRLNLTSSAKRLVGSLTPLSITHPLETQATSTWNYTVRDGSNRPSIQYHQTSTGAIVPDRLYAYLGDRLVATYEFQTAPVGWVYYTGDHLGSIRLEGSHTHDYFPFGEE